jgi:uncharacterized OB-fold protein
MVAPSAHAAPRPTPDEESAFFWEALTRHRLLLQRCRECGRHRFPPLPSCPWCAASGADVVEAEGTGVVYSWVTVHRPVGGAPDADVPYTIATVTLSEGCRVFARLETDGTPAKAGAPVTARFVDRADGWTELRFGLAGTAS